MPDGNDKTQPPTSAPDASGERTVTLDVAGTHCASCVMRVEGALKGLRGASAA